MLNVEKVYVIHYTKLPERKQKLGGYFRENNIKAEYITSFDKDALTDEIIKEFYSCDEEKYKNTIDKLYKSKSIPFRVLNRAEISCAIKHYTAIEKIAEECQHYGLILEDDILFRDNFINNFNHYLCNTPNDWDVIFMGNCCGLKPDKIENNKNAYLIDNPSSKCADAFLIKSSMASKICQTMKPFNTAADWEYSWQFYLHNAKVYWWEPSLVYQGSEYGVYKSSLR